MTIGGPKGPTGPKPPVAPPGVDKLDKAEATDAARESGGPRFAEALQGPAASDATQPTGAGDAIDALAAQVDAGELSARQAAEAIVERVVSARPGLDAVSQKRLRETLMAQLEDDPQLAATLRSLEGGG